MQIKKEHKREEAPIFFEESPKAERDIHCVACSTALSDMERLILGDRCVLCSTGVKYSGGIRGFILYILGCYHDWGIFKLMFRIREELEDPDCQLNALLGYMGYRRITDVPPEKKRSLKKNLKKLLEGSLND